VSKLVKISFGRKSVDTQLTMQEIVPKIHNITEHLNSLVKRHASVVDPFQRAGIERQIEEKFFALQNFNAKFGKAFLQRVDRNILYVSKLISNMAKRDIRSLFSRYPNPEQALENYRDLTKDNLQVFIREASEDRDKEHYLRRFAKDVIGRSNSIIGSATKTVVQRLEAYKKQQVAIQQQELTTKQRQQQAISGKQQTALRPKT